MSVMSIPAIYKYINTLWKIQKTVCTHIKKEYFAYKENWGECCSYLQQEKKWTRMKEEKEPKERKV